MTHGLRATYVRGCRCEQCRKANSDYARMRDRRAAYAKHNPDLAPLIDSTPVREHLRELRKAGMGRRTIAARAGVSQTVVARLLEVDRSRPAARIRRETATKLLGVQPDRLAPSALVDGIGTQRRLQALVAIGYTQHYLAQRIGWTDANLGTLLYDRGKVTQRTHDEVAALFTELELTPGPHARARLRAGRKGWAPPLAWDDIDDPAEQPNLGDDGDQAYAFLEDWHETYWEHRGYIPAAAARFGIAPQTLEQRLRRLRKAGHELEWTGRAAS